MYIYSAHLYVDHLNTIKNITFKVSQITLYRPHAITILFPKLQKYGHTISCINTTCRHIYHLYSIVIIYIPFTILYAIRGHGGLVRLLRTSSVGVSVPVSVLCVEFACSPHAPRGFPPGTLVSSVRQKNICGRLTGITKLSLVYE